MLVEELFQLSLAVSQILVTPLSAPETGVARCHLSNQREEALGPSLP